MIADEIIVDYEDEFAPAQEVQYIQFFEHLSGCLGAGTATVDGDDVTKLALEGTPARELDRHRLVFVHLEKIETRNALLPYTRFFGNAVEPPGAPAFEVGGNRREDLVDFAHYHVIGQAK